MSDVTSLEEWKKKKEEERRVASPKGPTAATTSRAARLPPRIQAVMQREFASQDTLTRVLLGGVLLKTILAGIPRNEGLIKKLREKTVSKYTDEELARWATATDPEIVGRPSFFHAICDEIAHRKLRP